MHPCGWDADFFVYRITNVFLLLLSKIDETSLVHGSTNFIIISKYNEGLEKTNICSEQQRSNVMIEQFLVLWLHEECYFKE